VPSPQSRLAAATALNPGLRASEDHRPGPPDAGGPAGLIRFQSGDVSADVAVGAQGLVAGYPRIGRLA
jgi:hypothetical protein